VRVDDPGGLGQQMLPELQDPVRVPEVVCCESKHPKALCQRAPFQFTAFRADDELLVPTLPQPARQAQQLPLPTAQSTAGIDVNNLQQGRNSKLEIRNSSYESK
jgi:hypothetical protein